MLQKLSGWCRALVVLLLLAFGLHAQTTANERTFPQPKAIVEKALKSLQPTAGRLPTLEGFAAPGSRPLDRFQRAYYQCTVDIRGGVRGQTEVRVITKITAWYADPVGAKSGYETLPSNGRLEADLLDRLSDALNVPSSLEPDTLAADKAVAGGSILAQPDLSAPVPRLPAVNSPLTGAAMPNSTKKSSGSAGEENLATHFPSQPPGGQQSNALNVEAKNLEEILRNQSHPTNLVAVRKGGAPVLASPAEGAKLLFTASAEDEFEILDMNVSWVHVRISGLARGWIRRANLEMDDDAVTDKRADDVQPFRVTKRQMASFPGDWEPLRGKTVEIVSIQGSSDAASGGWRAKRDYAKLVFDQEYAQLSQAPPHAIGVVLIFDAEDGGMVAATEFSLQQLKNGAVSQDDFWKQCFFDPPETFGAASQ